MPGISRRTLVRGGGALLGGGVLLSAAGCSGFGTPDWDVAVIGAGITGLSAARNLVDHGMSAVVLEARGRIGGQVHTDHSFTSVPVELGAGLIHGSDAYTWELVDESGADTVRVRGGSGGGSPIETDSAPLDTEDAASYLRRMDVPESDWPPVSIDNEPLDRWSATWMHRYDLFDWWSASRENHRVVDGYDRVLEPLADGLDVRLSTPVREVRRIRSGVELAAGPDGEQIFRAARCIIALPLGVLQTGDVRFDPPLPTSHLDAVRSLDTTDALKLVYEFDRPVFPEEPDALGWEQGADFVFWRISTGDADSGSPEVVAAWAAGAGARDLLAMDEDARFDAGLAALADVLGEELPAPVARTTHDWAADRYSRGAYLYVPPGAHDAPAALAEPVDGVLHFAGEPTTGENTVEGGYVNGYDVTDQLIAGL
ncbi:FAD-dependent oxidoreductase [Nocardiopsis sp. HNM0947]|uniref:FAD-dependent oxidoreductase n=1 Tax=Nocardiopsis coralli TaxID=2772213 RepID=A0ABR9P287_9ACTN|nr:NAD(P)/FAD-dependent oxidoreductase [Nocardiopsis coralli]MBE2997946.1 FAD-dependent oxidoreductase [Nocardiopsis coralli]